MFFIGGGTLLHHAVHYSQSIGLGIGGVCCPSGESAGRALRNFGIQVIESDDPSTDLAKLFASVNVQTVFSINNEHLLGDTLLSSGPAFFNIHNGLVQKYRGRSEVCIFAALCKNEEEYGVTLHQILPGRRVDCGAVVAQMAFDVLPQDSFCDVMGESLKRCRQIFERNVSRIAQGRFQATEVQVAARSYSYGDLAGLYAQAAPEVQRRAAGFGEYRPYFPRLQRLVAPRERLTAQSHGKGTPQRKPAIVKGRK